MEQVRELKQKLKGGTKQSEGQSLINVAEAVAREHSYVS